MYIYDASMEHYRRIGLEQQAASFDSDSDSDSIGE